MSPFLPLQFLLSFPPCLSLPLLFLCAIFLLRGFPKIFTNFNHPISNTHLFNGAASTALEKRQRASSPQLHPYPTSTTSLHPSFPHEQPQALPTHAHLFSDASTQPGSCSCGFKAQASVEFLNGGMFGTVLKCCYCCFEIDSSVAQAVLWTHYVAEAGLEFLTLFPLPPGLGLQACATILACLPFFSCHNGWREEVVQIQGH